jgi:hypothetical protein
MDREQPLQGLPCHGRALGFAGLRQQHVAAGEVAHEQHAAEDAVDGRIRLGES